MYKLLLLPTVLLADAGPQPGRHQLPANNCRYIMTGCYSTDKGEVWQLTMQQEMFALRRVSHSGQAVSTSYFQAIDCDHLAGNDMIQLCNTEIGGNKTVSFYYRSQGIDCNAQAIFPVVEFRTQGVLLWSGRLLCHCPK